MATADSHRAHGFSADAFTQSIPRQLPILAPENDAVLPAPTSNIPPPYRGVAEPGRIQDLHHIDVAYKNIINYHPQPLDDPAYVFPDAGHAQGIPVQVQPNSPVNQAFDYIPPNAAPDLVQAAVPVHQIPAPPPPKEGAENLRRLASHYLHHPDAKVSMVTMEASTAGRVKVAVFFETPDF